MDVIEEFCKNKLINTSLFRDSSAKFLDPNFDVKSFLCEVLKLVDIPNISPILSEQEINYYPQRTDFSGLSAVGDPRVSLGLSISAGYTNFMPRNIVYAETYKYGGARVINNYICDKDGNPIKIQTSTSLESKPQEEKLLDVKSILEQPEVANLYPHYDFSKTICLEQPEIKIANLDSSIDDIDQQDNINPPVFTPGSNKVNNLFVYDYSLDLCLKDLDYDMLFVPTTPDEYTNFTNDFIKFGRNQHSLYFIEFLKKFFLNRGWTLSFNKITNPPIFYIKLTKKSGSTDFTSLSGSNGYSYTSTVKHMYFKYWEDQMSFISEKLNIQNISVNISSTGLNPSSNAMMRAITDQYPDYKRIMKDPLLQKLFYQYAKVKYTEIPQYENSATKLASPIKKLFVV